MNLLKILGIAKPTEPTGVDWEARFVLKHDPTEVEPELNRLAGELARIVTEHDRATRAWARRAPRSIAPAMSAS